MADDAMELIREGYRARREQRLVEAHRDFSQAVDSCRRTGPRPQLVQALKGLGQIERDLGRGEAARPLYEEATALCREEGDALALAHTVRHLGDIHQETGNLDLAEPCYREALSIYRRHPETATLDLANTVRPLAILKGRLGEVQEAIQLWKEARDLYSALDVKEGVAESSSQLARLSDS